MCGARCLTVQPQLFFFIINSFFAHGIIWEDDEAAGGSVDCGGRGARTDSVLRVARCHPRRRGNVPRQPGWDEEACGGGGGDGGHLSSSPPPPSLHPTIVHGSILSLPFLLLSSSILRQPASPCLPARLLRASLHSPHISRLTTAANEGSYLGGGFWWGEGFMGGDKSVVHHFV